jgi:CheY-like chemotaxis protein
MMKKILVFDEEPIVNNIKRLTQFWGYESIGLSSAECIEDAVIQNDIDLIILAKEMKTKGPSLFGSLLLKTDLLKSLDDIEIDYEFGLKIYERLRKQSIRLPVIFITTDDLDETDLRYYPGLNGAIRAVMIEKPFGSGEELRTAIEKCLGLCNS